MDPLKQLKLALLDSKDTPLQVEDQVVKYIRSNLEKLAAKTSLPKVHSSIKECERRLDLISTFIGLLNDTQELQQYLELHRYQIPFPGKANKFDEWCRDYIKFLRELSHSSSNLWSDPNKEALETQRKKLKEFKFVFTQLKSSIVLGASDQLIPVDSDALTTTPSPPTTTASTASTTTTANAEVKPQSTKLTELKMQHIKRSHSEDEVKQQQQKTHLHQQQLVFESE